MVKISCLYDNSTYFEEEKYLEGLPGFNYSFTSTTPKRVCHSGTEGGEGCARLDLYGTLLLFFLLAKYLTWQRT